MHTNLAVTAALGICKTANGVIALPGAFFLDRVGDLIDKVRQQCRVPLLPEQYAIRGVSITPGTSGFLVILLDGFGQ